MNRELSAPKAYDIIEEKAYSDKFKSALSSSGSSIFSQNDEPDWSDDVRVASSVSASFNWDANLESSHCMYPGIGLRVANIYMGKVISFTRQLKNISGEKS